MGQGNQPLALDTNTMGKGQIWINGQSIGRHWPGYKASGTCGGCSYAGWFDEKKCLSNCGEASQRWSHVPWSWLKPAGNLLVLFEELDGNPYGITLVKREVADIYEWQPTLMNWQMQHSGEVNKPEAESPPLVWARKSIQSSLLALEHQKVPVDASVRAAVMLITHMTALKGTAFGKMLAQ